MYADKVTRSMERTIDETNRRRVIQTKYNEEHGMVPTALNKTNENAFQYRTEEEDNSMIAADPVEQYMDKSQLEKSMKNAERQMKKAAKDFDFMEAARLRDEMYRLQNLMKGKEV
jgi:excinuclease ABC subunit B